MTEKVRGHFKGKRFAHNFRVLYKKTWLNYLGYSITLTLLHIFMKILSQPLSFRRYAVTPTRGQGHVRCEGQMLKLQFPLKVCLFHSIILVLPSFDGFS